MTTETTAPAERAKQEAKAIAVTRDMLTEALTEFYLTVREGTGYLRGQVADPAIVADVLHATLSRIAAGYAPDETPATVALRDAVQVEAAMAILERRYPSARPDYLDIAITELCTIARSWRRQAAQVEAAGRTAEVVTADEGLITTCEGCGRERGDLERTRTTADGFAWLCGECIGAPA